MSLSTLLMLEASLAEPAAQSVLTPAVSWVEALVVGSIATMLGVTAIAVCGLLMLSGRIDVRRGLTVVTGCFLVFGASTIADGLRSVGTGEEPTMLATPAVPVVQLPVQAMPPPPAVYDPYAGASVAH